MANHLFNRTSSLVSDYLRGVRDQVTSLVEHERLPITYEGADSIQTPTRINIRFPHLSDKDSALVAGELDKLPLAPLSKSSQGYTYDLTKLNEVLSEMVVERKIETIEDWLAHEPGLVAAGAGNGEFGVTQHPHHAERMDVRYFANDPAHQAAILKVTKDLLEAQGVRIYHPNDQHTHTDATITCNLDMLHHAASKAVCHQVEHGNTGAARNVRGPNDALREEANGRTERPIGSGSPAILC